MRKTTTGTAVMMGKTSRRLIAGTMVMMREGVAMAMPAVEQMGQACEAIVAEFKSIQQCNWAARKMPARSKARK